MSNMENKMKFCTNTYMKLPEFIITGVFFVLALIQYTHGVISFRKNKAIKKIFSISFVFTGIMYIISLIFSRYIHI